MKDLGARHIDDVLTFYVNTTRFDTGAATDADAVPAYRVYEEETGTPILTGNMALLDSSSTAGFYSEQITLSAANGFEVGKSYAIYISATVNSVAGATHQSFVMRKKPLTPTTEGRELTVESDGMGHADVKEWIGEAVPATVATGVPNVRMANSVTHGGAAALFQLGSTSATPAFWVQNNTGAAVEFSGTGSSGSPGLRLLATGTAQLALELNADASGFGMGRSASSSNPIFDAVIKAEIQQEVDDALAARGITSTRSGYWDNLNVGGPVASQADINALNQSASRRVLLATVPQYERPESGSNTYTIEARTFDADGAAVNADSTPTLTATGEVSGNLSGNLSAASNPSTGVYRWTYTVSNAATIEQIRMDLSATISAATFTMSVYTQTADFVASTWTAADRTKLEAIHLKLPSKSYLTGTANSDGDIELTDATGTLAKTTQITGFNDPTAAANAYAVWEEILTGATHNVPNSAGRRLRALSSMSETVSSVNDAAATTTSFVTALTNSVTDFYADQLIIFTSGALTGQSRLVQSYNGTSKVIEVDEPLTSAPANGDAFTLLAHHIHSIPDIAAGVDTQLSDTHGDGSWEGAGGGATAEDIAAAMFTYNTGETKATAVAGSVVKETARQTIVLRDNIIEG